jgi:hypothetical protein
MELQDDSDSCMRLQDDSESCTKLQGDSEAAKRFVGQFGSCRTVRKGCRAILELESDAQDSSRSCRIVRGAAKRF